jgi:ABC-2 type transport system ATP-binding protein
VLVSSHVMSELEDTADDLVVIGRGRLIADTSVSSLLEAMTDGRVHVRTPQAGEAMVVLAGAGGTVTSTGADTLTVTGLDAPRIAQLTVERGLPLHELAPHRASLEEAFVELTRDEVEFAAGHVTEPAA